MTGKAGALTRAVETASVRFVFNWGLLYPTGTVNDPNTSEYAPHGGGYLVRNALKP